MKRTRVLIVDDSAFVRKTIGSILGRSAELSVVGYAGDGREALQQVLDLRPDVVTVDLEMPILNGVQFIEKQMSRAPIPIVVVSAIDPSGDLAVASMRAGAVEFVLKPTHLADQRLAQIEEDLLEKVLAVASIPKQRLLLPVAPTDGVPSEAAETPAAPENASAVVIGLSTGGPQVLHKLLPSLPAGFPLALAAVIHMPPGFTGPLADRLNQNSALEVLEAREGMVMQAGRCIVGRAGHQLLLRKDSSGRVVVALDGSSFPTAFRPSVDDLFRSASECYGTSLLGLVLTGMGSDGREGSAWIKAGGGRVYTQTESSSTVWGMPRAVWESGLSDGQLSPDEIAPFLCRVKV